MKEKKRIYVQLVETFVRFGYDISEMLNPTYKNLNVEKMQNLIAELHERHQEENYYLESWNQ